MSDHDNDSGFYTLGEAANAQAPIMITHFEGAMDAGSAGTLAVIQILRSLNPQRVATFKSDNLIDYRAHRPMAVVENWVTQDIVTPEIALDLVHDDTGTPILVLHGPEPDVRWEAFTDTVAKLAKKAGVEMAVSFHGIPAATPHTRPVNVHVQSTDSDLVPRQPLMGTVMQFPAPLSVFLQDRLSREGIQGIGLIAGVPYYLAESTYPRAASALLSKLSEMTGLSLPIGDLERGADSDASQINRVLSENEEVNQTVQALEHHYDAMAEASEPEPGTESGAELELESAEKSKSASEPSEDRASETNEHEDADNAGAIFKDPLEGVENSIARLASDSMAEAIGDAVEQYLKTQSEHSSAADENSGKSKPLKPQPRTKGRHRAPKPWEKEDED